MLLDLAHIEQEGSERSVELACDGSTRLVGHACSCSPMPDGLEVAEGRVDVDLFGQANLADAAFLL